MLLLVLSCADGKGITGANACPIGIGAAALAFGCRKAGLGARGEIVQSDVNGSADRLAELNRTREDQGQVRCTAIRVFACFR